MFISWSGRGLLIIPIIVIVAFITIPIVPVSRSLLWPAITSLISGIIIYLLGRYWNIDKHPIPQDSSLIATETKYQKIAHNRHKLYWIPIQYIGLLLIILAIALFIIS